MSINPHYSDALHPTGSVLGKVVTLPEACVMWRKTQRQLQYAIWRDQIVARKAFTGGVWILDYNSVVELWGQPKTPIESFQY